MNKMIFNIKIMKNKKKIKMETPMKNKSRKVILFLDEYFYIEYLNKFISSKYIFIRLIDMIVIKYITLSSFFMRF